MDGQKLLMATIAGAITSLIGGFLYYGMAMNSYFMENSMAGLMKEQPDWLFLIIAHLFFGVLVSYIFMKWAGISTWLGGLKGGLILGLLMSLTVGFLNYATTNMYTGGVTNVILDVVGSVIVWGMGGLGVGAMLGMSKKNA